MEVLSSRLQRAAYRMAPILLVALVTLVAFTMLSIGLAHVLFQQTHHATKKCLIQDPRTGVRGVPGSFCREKTYETSQIDYRFNDCGFRTPQPCGPPAPNVFRIVLIGSSFNFGMRVAQSDSYAAHLGPMLSARLHRPIDIFNESMIAGFPGAWALRPNLPELPHPNLILWPVTPMDIRNPFLLPGVLPKPKLAPGMSPPAAPITIEGWSWPKFVARITDFRIVFVLQHFLYLSPSQYLNHTLSKGHEVDYLRTPAPAALQDDLTVFARNFHQVALRARATKVPIVVTLLPTREQAIMLSNGTWDKGYDPYQLGRMVRRIVEADGARFIDMTPGITRIPDAENGFLPVDGHPTAQGQQMIATLMGNALVRSNALAPALKVTGR